MSHTNNLNKFNMKKLLTIVFLLTGSYVFGQSSAKSSGNGPSVRLTGYTTYAFDDNHVDSYYSSTSYFSGSVKGGFQYGGGLEVMPFPQAGLEVTYLRLDSKAPLTYYNDGEKYANFDLASNYVFLGFNKYAPVNPKIEPYAGLQLGIGIYNITNPTNDNSSSSTKFAWGIKAGTNIWVSEKVGIKLQANLISAVQAVGGGVYFGTGGSGASVSGYSTYWQFSLGGGLVFKLK
jgi:opacity protein-like surface antigen